MGHSAGGHLALWLASKLPLHGVVSLAGIADLLAYEALGNECSQSLPGLLGGSSREQPERWAEVDPVRLPIFDAPLHCIHGELDSIVPVAQSEALLRSRAGALHVVAGGGHFDLISPRAEAWLTIVKVLKELAG